MVPVNVGDAIGAAPKAVKAAEAVVAPVPPAVNGKVPVVSALVLLLAYTAP